AIGHPVLTLERVRLGFLTLEGLRAGQFRALSKQEVDKLKQGLVQNRRSRGPKA
ncbi:pseudouridine synthase, partial [Mesorhizobium sp. M00.F.Ca.ET.186.01.1.1]